MTGPSTPASEPAGSSVERVPQPYEVLADLIRNAPGRSAAQAALITLRSLAADGDFGALLSLCRVLALELGMDATVPGLLSARSLADIVGAAETAPLVRVYALGFRPRQLIMESGSIDLARQAQDTDISGFRALVERDAPLAVEVLKAYLLSAVGAGLTFGPDQDFVSAGTKIDIVDQILISSRIVPGDAADATFEFGRDMILGCADVHALLFVIHHELGHHIFNAAQQGSRGSAVIAVGPESVQALSHALPAMLDAAAAAAGQPLNPGDPRGCRLPDGLSVLCTLERRPGGTYSHFSLTNAAGPIDFTTALVLAYSVLHVLGADPAQVSAVYSARGVFHFGIGGPPPSHADVAARAQSAGPDLVADPAAAHAWYAALESAGRTGANENDIRYILGVDPRPPTVYGRDAENSWRDQQVRSQVVAAADLQTETPETLAELLRVAVRCGDPDTVSRVVASAAAAGQANRADPGLAHLGVSAFVLRDQEDLSYAGPVTASLVSVLGLLHDAGYGLDGIVTDDGQTLLTDAAGRSARLASQLIRAGASVDQPNRSGQTALARAVRLADADVVQTLLDSGAAVRVKDSDGLTPLHYAARRGDAALAGLLISRGADIEARTSTGDTALAFAQSLDIVSALCAAKADPNSHSNSGATPLMAAAQRHDMDVVRALLTAGADPDAATDLGETALHFAAHSAGTGALDVVMALLDAGADIDEETDEGITPLMAAAMQVNTDVVAYLLQRGANVNAQTVNGNTAVMFASDGRKEWSRDMTLISRMTQCIDLLASASADLDLTDGSGATALHWATTGFSAEPVEMLLQHGANPHVQAQDGSTPLSNARAQDHEKMIQDLMAAGAADDSRS